LKPYHHSGFQNSGEKIREAFAKADRLEAGGFNPLGGKSRISQGGGVGRSWMSGCVILRKIAHEAQFCARSFRLSL
jgi:hypothetical protein